MIQEGINQNQENHSKEPTTWKVHSKYKRPTSRTTRVTHQSNKNNKDHKDLLRKYSKIEGKLSGVRGRISGKKCKCHKCYPKMNMLEISSKLDNGKVLKNRRSGFKRSGRIRGMEEIFKNKMETSQFLSKNISMYKILSKLDNRKVFKNKG